MIKRLFDWTPRDTAYWVKIRQKGLRRFIGWYGVIISGGLLFIVFSLGTIFYWVRESHSAQVTSGSLLILAAKLLFVALVCILAGIINSLVTWAVEERMYRKFVKIYKPDNIDSGST